MLEASHFTPAATACIQALPPRAILSLAAFQGKTDALQTALGLALPATPRRIAQPGYAILWSGPAAWLFVAVDPAALPSLTGRAASLAAITEQGDGRALFRVSGPHARKILAKLVPIDLHETVFPEDATAITLAAHIGIQLWREEDAFILACFRSFAAALHHALLEAANQFEHIPPGRG